MFLFRFLYLWFSPSVRTRYCKQGSQERCKHFSHTLAIARLEWHFYNILCLVKLIVMDWFNSLFLVIDSTSSLNLMFATLLAQTWTEPFERRMEPNLFLVFCLNACNFRHHISNIMSSYWFYLSIQVAAPFKLWVCGHSLAGIAGSNPTGDMDICLLWILCVFSRRGLCVWLITRPEESYRVWCVWVWLWSLDNEETLTQ